MADYLVHFKDWIFALGVKHHVNPVLLGCLYLGSKLLVVSFLAWCVKNLRAKKPFFIALTLAAVSFSIPYFYLVIAGRNIPFWIYLFLASVVFYAAFTTWKKVAALKQDRLTPH